MVEVTGAAVRKVESRRGAGRGGEQGAEEGRGEEEQVSWKIQGGILRHHWNKRREGKGAMAVGKTCSMHHPYHSSD